MTCVHFVYYLLSTDYCWWRVSMVLYRSLFQCRASTRRPESHLQRLQKRKKRLVDRNAAWCLYVNLTACGTGYLIISIIVQVVLVFLKLISAMQCTPSLLVLVGRYLCRCKCALRAERPICMICNHYSTILSKDASCLLTCWTCCIDAGIYC